MKITMELTESETVLLSHALQWSIAFYVKRARTLKTPLIKEQCRSMANSLALIRMKVVKATEERDER